MSGEEELDRALAELEETLDAGRRPDRYLARAVLVALGERLVAAEGAADAGLAARLERARRAGERPSEQAREWERTAYEELELACAEHVRSADPRFLALERYDWSYTLEARRRLTARLVAARALGLALPEKLLERVEEADALLARHLQGP